MNPASTYLDPQLTSLLSNLRSRVRRYIWLDSLLAVAAVVLVAFWLGLALDFLPVQVGGTEMPRSARGVLLALVGAAVLGLLLTLLVARLRRPLPDDSLALLVERHHPQLSGRLVTAVQLSRPDRSGDSHSPELLRRVHSQAAAAIDEVDPNRVFRWQPLVRKSLVVGPLLLMALALAIFSPDAFGRAAKRLTLLSDDPWPRRAELEMVGIELPVVTAADDDEQPPQLLTFEDKRIRLPRGSSPLLRIRAAANTAIVPTVCTMYYNTEDGTRGQSNLRRVGRVQDGFQSFVLDGPPLSGLTQTMTFSIRGLDDRLDDYVIEAIEPPALVQMQVRVRYPNYLRNEGSGDFDFDTEYQSGLRLREGSDVTLRATSTRPLGNILSHLQSDAGAIVPDSITYSSDRREVAIQLSDMRFATTVRIVPLDPDGISAQAPFRYFLGIILDEPPEVTLRLKGIGSAVTPIANLPVEITATDDYAIEQASVSIAPGGEELATESEPISTSPKLERDGEGKTQLDLRELVAAGTLAELKPGGAINVYAEAADAYNLGEPHLARSELFRLQVVTPEQLLGLLERRELGLRGRLEQTIDETRSLRDTLDVLRRVGFSGAAAATDSNEPAEPTESTSSSDAETSNTETTRQEQVRRLRVQQSGLQASKTSEELSGIAASLDDLLEEMINNRVDSVDRRERIGVGVRDPLRKIVDEPLKRLQDQIRSIDAVIGEPMVAAERTANAVATAEDVLLQLTAVLEKMLDLESYNEILDMVRELIEDQNQLLDDTKTQQKKSVLDLFK